MFCKYFPPFCRLLFSFLLIIEIVGGGGRKENSLIYSWSRPENAKVTPILHYKAIEEQINLWLHETTDSNRKKECSGQLSYESSAGWLACFKGWYIIKLLNFQARQVLQVRVLRKSPSLRYSLKIPPKFYTEKANVEERIFKADETGLFYKDTDKHVQCKWHFCWQKCCDQKVKET